MNPKKIENSSMDQVRDLLMGSHLKEMETRLQRQEKNMQRELTSLRDNFQNRIDSLENFIKSEFASVLRRLQEEKDERTNSTKNEVRERNEAIKTEQKERTRNLKEEKKEREDAFKKLEQELLTKDRELERKFNSISASLDSAEQGLRQLMLSENARLSQSLEEKYQNAISLLSNTNQQIRDDVVARSALSSIFAEAAVRFSEPPDNDEYEDNSSEEKEPQKGNNEQGK